MTASGGRSSPEPGNSLEGPATHVEHRRVGTFDSRPAVATPLATLADDRTARCKRLTRRSGSGGIANPARTDAWYLQAGGRKFEPCRAHQGRTTSSGLRRLNARSHRVVPGRPFGPRVGD